MEYNVSENKKAVQQFGEILYAYTRVFLSKSDMRK